MDHADLLAKANVVAVGIGYKYRGGELVIDNATGEPVMVTVVSVSQKLDLTDLALRDAVPPMYEGQPTDVVEVGVVRVLPSAQGLVAELDPTQRIRPVRPGLSTGLNPGVTAGTIGFIVEKPGNSQNYILSNWHVIAASNVPVEDRDVVTITQPGNHDGGSVPADVIAELVEFVPIGATIPDLSDCDIGGTVARIANAAATMVGSRTRLQAVRSQAESDQLVDAAIGKLSVEATLEIPEVGSPTSSGVAQLGMQVQKYGRTTRFTQGEVTQVGMSVLVQGYPDGPVLFVDQVAITGHDGPFLQGGDSGSGLLWGLEAVGLCFAGSDTIGIANQFENVADALGIVLARS